MLNYAVFFFVIALVAAAFGFSGAAVGADSAVGAVSAVGTVTIAKVLFFVFAALAAISFLIGLLRRT